MAGDSQFKITTGNGFSFNLVSTSKKPPYPIEILLSELDSCCATDVALNLQSSTNADLGSFPFRLYSFLDRLALAFFNGVNCVTCQQLTKQFDSFRFSLSCHHTQFCYHVALLMMV